jgi:hypothetical protein
VPDVLGSLDGIVGPGSEWFWAAAQFFVVVISLAGIYLQLRSQGTANSFHQMATLHDRWNSERLIRARLALIADVRNRGEFGATPTLMPVCDFFEDIALLQGRGHLPRTDVWEDWNRTVEFWWTLLSPVIHARRRLYPGDFEGFERLDRLMREMDAKAGHTNEFDAATISTILDDMIAGLTASLRLEQESKAGIVPAPPARNASPHVSGADSHPTQAP